MANNLQEQIKFCEEKAKNIKLRTEPQTFIDIKSSLEKLQKIEEVITSMEYTDDEVIESFAFRQIEQIVKEVGSDD